MSFFINNAWAQTAAAPQTSSPYQMFLLPVAMLAIMYFLMIRPQQKQNKKKQELISNLKRGDEILMANGFVGKITEIDGQFLSVQLSPQTIVKVDKQQVAGVLNSEIVTTTAK